MESRRDPAAVADGAHAPLVLPGMYEAMAAVVAFSALFVADLTGGAPWWFLGAVLLALTLSQLRPVKHLLDGGPLRCRIGLSVGVPPCCGALLMYGTGWGPLLVGGLLIAVVGEIRHSGGHVWRRVLGWSVGAAVCGQTLLVTGVFHSYLSRGVSAGAFATGMLALVLLGRAYGTTTVQLEQEVVARRTSEERFKSLVQNSVDMTCILDAESMAITYVSPAAEHIIGYTPDWLVANGWESLVHPDDAHTATQALTRTIESGAPSTAEVRGRHADGTWHWWEFTVSNRVADPAIQALVGNVRDVTERRSYQEKLSYQATRDGLTKLLNRAAFLDALEHALGRARRHHHPTAVLFLDLDGFKQVNDTWGHHAGDVLLQTVAHRIQSSVRPGDTVGRFAGDEFVVILEDLTDAAEAYAVADRIGSALSGPVILEGNPTRPTASIGVAVSDAAVESADDLIRAADLRMYEVKQARSRTPWPPGRPALPTGPFDRTAYDTALAAGEFGLEYQPVFDLATGRLVCVEARSHWAHPDLDRIPPDTFLPAAERAGALAVVVRRILEDACTCVRGWDDHPELAGTSVAVAMPTNLLRDLSCVPVLRDVLTSSGLPADRLVLVVAHVPTDRNDLALTSIEGLRQLGVRVAVEQLGAAYASLSQLDALPIDVLKIDQAGVARVAAPGRSGSYLAAVCQLLAALDITPLAVGIADAGQAAAVAAAGIDLVQGDFFAPTVPAAGLPAAVAAARTRLAEGGAPAVCTLPAPRAADDAPLPAERS